MCYLARGRRFFRRTIFVLRSLRTEVCVSASDNARFNVSIHVSIETAVPATPQFIKRAKILLSKELPPHVVRTSIFIIGFIPSTFAALGKLIMRYVEICSVISAVDFWLEINFSIGKIWLPTFTRP